MSVSSPVMPFMNIRIAPACATIIGALILSAGICSAIIIRQDTPDEKYIELGTKFPAVCSFGTRGDGVLVARRWVLTASHVGRSLKPDRDKARFGDREFGIKRIVQHPEGKPSGNRPPEVDLALVEVDEDVEGIEPVALYRDRDELGKTITIVGHGDFGNGQTGPSRRTDGTRRAATNVITDAGPRRLFFIFDAPPGGTALEGVAGPGDSGGPAFIEKDGKLHVGGVSVASAEGKPGRYGVTEVYMRVSSYAGWITETAKNRD